MESPRLPIEQKTLGSSNGKADASKASDVGSTPSPGTMELVNARRLASYIKKSVYEMSKDFMFAFPDSKTRKSIQNSVDSMMAFLKSKDIICSYNVACDRGTSALDDDVRVNVVFQPYPTYQNITINFDMYGINDGILSRLANLEATQCGFNPGPPSRRRQSGSRVDTIRLHSKKRSISSSSNKINRFNVLGMVGLESGFVCDPSNPNSDPFFVVGVMAHHYILYNDGYKYFRVDLGAKRDEENIEYTTGDKEIIDCVIEKYASQNYQ